MTKKTDLTVVEANIRLADISKTPLSEQDIALATALNIDIAAPVEERIDLAVSKTSRALQLVVEAGILYLSIKAELPHGEFMPALEARGLSHQRVHECMVFAKASAALTPEQRVKLLSMPKKKAMALAGADADVLEEALDSGRFEDFKGMTLQALALELKASKKRENETQAKYSDLQEIHAALGKKRNLSDLKTSTHVIREETLANVANVQLGCAALEKLCDETLGESEGSPEHILRLEQVNFAIYAAAATALKTLARCASKLPPDLTQEITSAHLLTPEQADHWEQEWLTIQAGHRQKEIDRHNTRATELPRGKGRPANAPKAIKA